MKSERLPRGELPLRLTVVLFSGFLRKLPLGAGALKGRVSSRLVNARCSTRWIGPADSGVYANDATVSPVLCSLSDSRALHIKYSPLEGSIYRNM